MMLAQRCLTLTIVRYSRLYFKNGAARMSIIMSTIALTRRSGRTSFNAGWSASYVTDIVVSTHISPLNTLKSLFYLESRQRGS